jgi:hypothetical protein
LALSNREETHVAARTLVGLSLSLIAAAASRGAADASFAAPIQDEASAAATSIERSSVYEAPGVGIAGRPGRTWTALSPIVARGEGAKPLLARLASSKNPVARIAAAVGYGRLYPDARFPTDARRPRDAGAL